MNSSALLIEQFCSFLPHFYPPVFIFSPNSCYPFSHIVPAFSFLFSLSLFFSLHFALLICFNSFFLHLIIPLFWVLFCFGPSVSPFPLSLPLLSSSCLWANLFPTYHLVSLFYLSFFFPLFLSSSQQWSYSLFVGEASGPCWLLFSLLCSEYSSVINTTTEKHKIIFQGKHCIIILLVCSPLISEDFVLRAK